MVACVGVQQPLRLYRAGLRLLLSREDDIDVVGVVRTEDELVQLCLERAPEVVVLDAAVAQDLARVGASLHRSFPSMAIIGLTGATPTPADAAQARRCGVSTLVSRTDGAAAVLGAIRNRTAKLAPVCAGDAPPGAPVRAAGTALTGREVMVLKLVGAGCTSRQISARLDISHKTVENHKQRIFRKLGVQNQAHAVSVAMRCGQLRPERIVDVAAGD